MIGTLTGLGYGALKHRGGYRDAVDSIESGDTSELYEEISEFLDSYSQMHDRTSEIYGSNFEPGISNESQAAFALLTAKNPGRAGRRMGQIKAVNEMDRELSELMDMAEDYQEQESLDGSVGMSDVQSTLSGQAEV